MTTADADAAYDRLEGSIAACAADPAELVAALDQATPHVCACGARFATADELGEHCDQLNQGPGWAALTEEEQARYVEEAEAVLVGRQDQDDYERNR